MEIGTVLVGVALTAILAAYLARPFRVVSMESNQTIETWVARVREERRSGGIGEQGHKGAEEIKFCPQCGRQVGPDDRFCAGCGTQLRE